MINKICLVGNPNCGKTTLFNFLTNRHEKTGNRTGVTVEGSSARYKKNKDIEITDLPGTYSVQGDSKDEKVVTEFLRGFDGIVVNVVDGTNLLRNLELTKELFSLNIPIVLAVNMSDIMEENGVFLDEKQMENALKIPVVKISASKNVGVDLLIERAVRYYSFKREKDNDSLPDWKKAYDSIRFDEKKERKIRLSDKIDMVLLSPFLGIPIFVFFILFAYFITDKAGGFLGGIVADLFLKIGNAVYGASAGGMPVFITDLVCNAVIKGVGTVLSFLPQVVILFAFLSFMEESGYSARVAYLADGITSKIGLSGKSLISFGVSCGCAVGGITSARIIENENQRKLTVYLSPFMPCSAKTAVFAWLTGVLFNGNTLVFVSVYFLSFISIAIFGRLLSKSRRFKSDGYFIMEIPVLRFPPIRSVFGAMAEKTADFVLKAGSTIFLVSLTVWFLQRFGVYGYTENTENTFLYYIGNAVRYIFIPLGFGSWQASVAVISGLFAREAVIETLTMLTLDARVLFSSPYAAYSFMAFILLAPPCVSALTMAKRELADKKAFLFMLAFQFSAAYAVALTINVAGYIVQKSFIAFLSLTLIAVGAIISIKIIKRTRCGKCKGCGVKGCKIR